jgi:hypothetical protein
MEEMKTASQLVRQVTNRLFPSLGCSDGGCVFGDTGGMHTNGGCECLQERSPVQLRRQLMALSQVARTLAAVNSDD